MSQSSDDCHALVGANSEGNLAASENSVRNSICEKTLLHHALMYPSHLSCVLSCVRVRKSEEDHWRGWELLSHGSRSQGLRDRVSTCAKRRRPTGGEGAFDAVERVSADERSGVRVREPKKTVGQGHRGPFEIANGLFWR